MRKLDGDFIAGLVFVAVIIGLLLAGFIDRKADAERVGAGIKSEIAACEKAGYKEPAWLDCGFMATCFNCIDKMGGLHPVVEPECSRKGRGMRCGILIPQ